MAELNSRQQAASVSSSDLLPASVGGEFFAVSMETLAAYVAGQNPIDLSSKQDVLTAGTGITIDSNNVISSMATGDATNAVLITNVNQSIEGIKDFTTLRVGGVGVMLVGNDQTVGGVKTFTDPPVFPNGTIFPGTLQANGVVQGDLSITGDLTVGSTATQITNFLSTVANEGGRQVVTLTDTTSPAPIPTSSHMFVDGVETGVFDRILAFSTDNTGTISITAGVGEYYLVYVDINNWYLFETASTQSQAAAGAFPARINYYTTNVIASIGTYTAGDQVSLYSSTSSTSIEDFVDFFQTNTPIDTEVPWDASLGRNIVDAEGDTERVIGAVGISFLGSEAPLFSWATTTDQYEIGDIVRIRIYEDDVDQSIASPVIDVRKQISVTANSDIDTTTGDLGAGGFAFVIITSGGLTTLQNVSIETGTEGSNTFYYLATDQIRIDRSSQVQATQFENPSMITLDGRAEVGELETDGQVILKNLPTIDPLIDGKLWSNSGNIVQSGFDETAFGSVNGQIVTIGGNSVTVPTSTGGAEDDRIPSSTTLHNYPRFGGTDGGMEERTPAQVATDIGAVTNSDLINYLQTGSSPTITGTWTFPNTVNFGQRLVHDGESDTYIEFDSGGDRVKYNVGGREIVRMEDDRWLFNPGNVANTFMIAGLPSGTPKSSNAFVAVSSDNNNRRLVEAGITASDVSGLGTAATTDATSYATSAQGTKADSALQTLPTVNLSDLSTSVQGSLGKADSALQSLPTVALSNLSSTVQTSLGKADTALQNLDGVQQFAKDTTTRLTSGKLPTDVVYTEVGTWTPTGTLGTLNDTTSATYVKNGSVVHVFAQLDVTTFAVSGTNLITIGGNPYPPDSNVLTVGNISVSGDIDAITHLEVGASSLGVFSNTAISDGQILIQATYTTSE